MSENNWGRKDISNKPSISKITYSAFGFGYSAMFKLMRLESRRPGYFILPTGRLRQRFNSKPELLPSTTTSITTVSIVGAMWYIREGYRLSLSHHLLYQWCLLGDLFKFIVVPVTNWSLPSMSGRHTVAFRTGCTSFTAMRIIGSLFKFLMPALIVF